MEDVFMCEAIKQANKALKNGDIPVGAVVVKDNKIIARAYNRREKDKDSTGHAELIAIKKACRFLNDWRLNNCFLYVTLEPCSMCRGAAAQARVEKIIYGATNTNVKSKKAIVESIKSEDIKAIDKCSDMIRDFFENKRK